MFGADPTSYSLDLSEFNPHGKFSPRFWLGYGRIQVRADNVEGHIEARKSGIELTEPMGMAHMENETPFQIRTRLLNSVCESMRVGHYSEAVIIYSELLYRRMADSSIYLGLAQALQYSGEQYTAGIQLERLASMGNQSRSQKESCRFGRHTTNYWLWQTPRTCQRYGYCSDCLSKTSRTEHVWQTVNIIEHTCTRCGREDHQSISY